MLYGEHLNTNEQSMTGAYGGTTTTRAKMLGHQPNKPREPNAETL